MFKRPKGVSDPDPEAQRSAARPSDSSASTHSSPAADDDGKTGTRVMTPSYQARKPAVRQLQTSGPQPASSTAAANLHVGRGLKLEGKIQSCDALVIEGDVQATIESGTLTITETGEVRGDATVDEAEINGKFDGTLVVRKCLTINATGRIAGTVRYGELRVEQGGQVSGEIQAEDAKQTPRPALKPADNGDSKTESKIESSSPRSSSMA